MASKKSINVGIIGFGTVGTGTARILIENEHRLRQAAKGIKIALQK